MLTDNEKPVNRKGTRNSKSTTKAPRNRAKKKNSASRQPKRRTKSHKIVAPRPTKAEVKSLLRLGAYFVLLSNKKRALAGISWGSFKPTLETILAHRSLVGLVYSFLGIACIDIDKGDPQKLIRLLQRHKVAYRKVKSPHGWHILIQMPRDIFIGKIRSTHRKLGITFDFLHDRGYGVVYSWEAIFQLLDAGNRPADGKFLGKLLRSKYEPKFIHHFKARDYKVEGGDMYARTRDGSTHTWRLHKQLPVWIAKLFGHKPRKPRKRRQLWTKADEAAAAVTALMLYHRRKAEFEAFYAARENGGQNGYPPVGAERLEAPPGNGLESVADKLHFLPAGDAGYADVYPQDPMRRRYHPAISAPSEWYVPVRWRYCYGNRNTALYQDACIFLMQGRPLYQIIAWARESGLSDAEIRRTLASAMKRVSKNPLYLLAQGYLPLPGLTPRQVRALQEQALHATWADGSGCYPSNGAVAKRMGLKGGSWVNLLLQAIEEAGYLARVGKQRRGVIDYRVSLGALMRGVEDSVVELAREVVTLLAEPQPNRPVRRQLALSLAVDGGVDARAGPIAGSRLGG